ncbi:MAG TPA: chemotaxis protein CheW [Rubrivivax sp.]|nr:chemotaxis protein CheW [Rubrivivax sp.]
MSSIPGSPASSDPTQPRADAGAGMDMRQFHALFFDEAGENLERMEQLLIGLDIASAGDEALHAIFRCAHSIKGGAATFGFGDVAELTHQMESLLDRLRRRELAPTEAMVDTLLQAGDALKAQLARHQDGAGEPLDTAVLVSALQGMAGAGRAVAASATAGKPASAVPADAGERLLEMTLGPLQDTAAVAGLVAMFSEITDLGRIEPLPGAPVAEGMHRFKLSTTISDAELIDLCSFHVHAALVQLSPLPPPAHAAPLPAPAAGAAAGLAVVAPAGPRATPAPADAGSLRVAVDKVDQLVNLVGELVITQAMLAQRCAALEPLAQQQLAAGFGDLGRHTRNLQDAVMSIRMIPMSTVFSRFPRLLRDLSGQLGKKIELVTQGETTELDKGLIEKITDPLTHLVRNSCDHGIELPAERVACGKPESGTITLSAAQQGGSIVIEVRDDGRGLSRARLLRKARECGLPASDSLSDEAVWALIFAPGFTTAEVVTEVSGRGVGMDVVKKNIGALGGVVEIRCEEGRGMSIFVRLPLTLAIMDSMSVRVADEIYVLPLSAVVESLQCVPGQVRTLVGGSAQVITLRDEVLPVLALQQVFGVQRSGDTGREGGILVVVEADGVRVALRVDELLGQQQVVVKNLESNFTRVDKISGATIMGDGRVALILDVAALVRHPRR